MLPNSIREDFQRAKKVEAISRIAVVDSNAWAKELDTNRKILDSLRRASAEDLGLYGLSVPQPALDIIAEFVAPDRMDELLDRLAQANIRTRPTLAPAIASKVLLDCVKLSASLLGPQNMQAALMVETTFKFLLNEVALVIRRHTETGRISEPDVQVIVQDVQRAIPDLRARVIEASKSNPNDNSNHS
jgi:hypothetical protein